MLIVVYLLMNRRYPISVMTIIASSSFALVYHLCVRSCRASRAHGRMQELFALGERLFCGAFRCVSNRCELLDACHGVEGVRCVEKSNGHEAKGGWGFVWLGRPFVGGLPLFLALHQLVFSVAREHIRSSMGR